jgi:putative ABC transport system permease protein
MAVMANTMAMAARERLSEYATLKALGFRPRFLSGLIFGESMFIAMAAGGVGILASFPLVRIFGNVMAKLFPVFQISTNTLAMQVAAAAVVGAVAAAVPSWHAARVGIAEGLRAIG